MNRPASLGPGELTTGDWTAYTLGDFVSTRARGIVPSKTPDETFELYSVPSLDTGAPEIVKGANIGSNKQVVDEGTVLLCKINPRINRAWVVSSHSEHQKIASTEWITFPPNDGVEPKYLAYFLKQNAVRDFLAANVSGVGGSLMRVKPATLKDYPFPVAPVPQQKHIVAEIEKQFSRLDEADANLNRVKANLKRYKAAVLKAAVEGRLVETETELAHREGAHFETHADLIERVLECRRREQRNSGTAKSPAKPNVAQLPTLPAGWVWISLDCLIIDGPQNGIYLPKALYGSGYPILRIDDYQQDWLRSVLELQRVAAEPTDAATYGLRDDDIVINRVNSPTHLGKVALWRTGGSEPALFESNMMRISVSSCVIPKYLTMYLRSPQGRQLLTRQAKWAVNQASINQKDVRGTPVPLPPPSEQARIVDEAERQLAALEQLDRQLLVAAERSARLRTTILRSAFGGPIVQGPTGATRKE